MVLNIIKLARQYLTSRMFSFSNIGQLNFMETFKCIICLLVSFAIFLLIFYFYTENRARCPLTFPKYQFRFCECDLLERDFHKFYIPEYELNRFCVNHLDNPDILYVDSAIQFSNYMQTKNNDKGDTKCYKMACFLRNDFWRFKLYHPVNRLRSFLSLGHLVTRSLGDLVTW